MLYYLFEYLETEYQLPGATLFRFLTFRAGMSVLLSLILATVYGKQIIRLLRRKQVGETVRDLGLEGQMKATALEGLEIPRGAAGSFREDDDVHPLPDPLRRVLQRTVENELSKRLLSSEIRTGDHVLVDLDVDADEKGTLSFTKVEQAPIAVELPVKNEAE